MMIDPDDHGVPSADEQGGAVATDATDARPGRRFDRGRLRLGIVVAVICGALAFLVMQGLGDATTYFRNADRAVAERAELGTDRFRLQGTVLAGSVRESGSADDPTVDFRVVYDCVEVPVQHSGVRPELFREGIPVVIEGAFASADDDTFRSDRIIVRHTEEYTDDEQDRLDMAAAEACRS